MLHTNLDCHIGWAVTKQGAEKLFNTKPNIVAIKSCLSYAGNTCGVVRHPDA